MCFQCKQTFYRKKIKEMLLRFELTSSVLRVLRLVDCSTAADRDNKQLYATLAVNLSSDSQLYFRISEGLNGVPLKSVISKILA